MGWLASSSFDRVDGDDVGVIERRDRFGFALEPLASVWIVRYLGQQYFERHLPFEPPFDHIPPRLPIISLSD